MLQVFREIRVIHVDKQMVFVDFGWDLQQMVLFNCEGRDGELMDEDWSTCSIHELLVSIQGVWRWNSLVS